MRDRSDRHSRDGVFDSLCGLCNDKQQEKIKNAPAVEQIPRGTATRQPHC